MTHRHQSDIKRALTSWGFIMAIIGMIIAIAISSAGDILPILQYNADDGRNMLMQGFHEQILLTALRSDIILMCVSILCALPYTAAFVDDYKSGYIKPYLARAGKKRYIKGKVAATGLSGGLGLFIGIIFVYIVFTLVFTPMETVMDEDFIMPSQFADILGRACIFFLAGSLWSMVGALMASVTMSKYMAYASPFIIYYVLIILSERYIKNVYVLNPKMWLTAPEMWPGKGWGVALFLTLLMVIISLGYAISVSRRIENA